MKTKASSLVIYLGLLLSSFASFADSKPACNANPNLESLNEDQAYYIVYLEYKECQKLEAHLRLEVQKVKDIEWTRPLSKADHQQIANLRQQIAKASNDQLLLGDKVFKIAPIDDFALNPDLLSFQVVVKRKNQIKKWKQDSEEYQRREDEHLRPKWD